MNYQLKKYPKYKPSGIPWIGEIPEHWAMKKIKHLCYVKGRVGWKGLKASEFLLKGYAFLITGTDFKDGLIDWNNCYQIDKERYEEDPYIQLRNNDLLLTKDGTIGKLAIVKNLDKPACLNSGIFVVRSLTKDFSTRFLYWLLSSSVFSSFNEYTSYGSTIQHLYQNVFVEFGFCFPLSKEQTAIVNYLDEKTVKIDSLIEKKKKLIQLYKEERAAVINQAVTRGLDPNVKLKDSGLSRRSAAKTEIDWLGKIPEHWEVKKLKYVAKLKSGESITSDNIKGADKYPVFGGNGLRGYTSSFTHNGNYVLIGRQGALCGNINYASGKFFASEHAVVVTRFNEEDINWFGELLRAMNLNQYSVSAAQPGLSVEKIQNLSIPYPPLDEQKEIGKYIETETKRIDEKIAKSEKQIELLQEYRTALISEVATGKIKVI